MGVALSQTPKQSKRQTIRQAEANMLLNAPIAKHGHFLI
jgi:hypothetical protein